ncbi:MAG: DUF2332 family protein [Actinomycetota bacterium]|nr:DUF2332 family protein [Actinomycetota bacterium]
MLDRLSGLLRHQAAAAAQLGSPMYGALLHRTAAELGRAGPVRRVLEPHADATGPAATGLRLLGAVHRLVLDGSTRDLARYYPSVGGTWDRDAAWPAFVALLDERHDDVARWMRRPPQTNEVGRAAALTGGLLRLVAAHPLPVRLYELGASAGLNLRADRFRYEGAGGGWGPVGSPVRLDPAWAGVTTPVDGRLDLVERVGCDPDPVDAGSAEGRLVLMSYVWPDQAVRLDRLRGAFRVAAEVPATVRQQSAAELVAGLDLMDGALTLLWHSVMWQYLGPSERAAVRGEVDRLGAIATERMPFAHLFLEPRRRTPETEHEFMVVLERWPGGRRTVLGSAHPHGVPVHWER